MNYKITNIEYGIGVWDTGHLYGETGNPKPGEFENNVHSITLVQGGGRNILVDTGVDTEDAEKDALWKSLDQHMLGTVWALDQVGLTPDDIDTIILTHAHIDHVGAVGRFKKANVFIQQKDFEAWERMAADPKYLQAVLPAAYPPDYPPMRKMVEEGRMTLLNGDVVNLLPGIDLHVFYDCQSVAEQVVIVTTEQGKYIIGGDIAVRPANLAGMGDWKGYLAPTLGRSGSELNVYAAYEWILDALEGDLSRLVLTHDSTMTDRFESMPTKDGLAIHYVVK